jgi:hypothetical protein
MHWHGRPLVLYHLKHLTGFPRRCGDFRLYPRCSAIHKLLTSWFVLFRIAVFTALPSSARSPSDPDYPLALSEALILSFVFNGFSRSGPLGQARRLILPHSGSCNMSVSMYDGVSIDQYGLTQICGSPYSGNTSSSCVHCSLPINKWTLVESFFVIRRSLRT